MPSPKQMEKLARHAARQPERGKPEPGPGDPLPEELWHAVLADPCAIGRPPLPIQQCRLSEIPRHVLRVECIRCFRIVEIQKADAVRFYGPHAVWKDVGQRLLDQTCSNRTGRHEEDGCWPDWST
jgi:hypothetical protein